MWTLQQDGGPSHTARSNERENVIHRAYHEIVTTKNPDLNLVDYMLFGDRIRRWFTTAGVSSLRKN